MVDQSLARLQAHRNNIRRYRHLLLEMKAADPDRAFIMTRLREEEAAMKLLVDATFPVTLLTSAVPGAAGVP